jgi:endoglucanase
LLLEALSNAFGPAGHENEVRRLVLEAIRSHVDRVQLDTLGNVLAYKGEGEAPLRVLLDAHMDEVGFMITHVEEGGWLRFGTVGTLDPRILPGQRVLVGPRRLPGVIGHKLIHLASEAEMDRVADAHELAIDVGPGGEGAAGQIGVGDYAVFDTRFGRLGPSSSDPRSGRVKGKAFDDRAGCAVLVETLKGDYPVEVVGAFTVQEEVGSRGAYVAAYTVQPDVAVVLEGTVADDLPGEEGPPPTTRLGHGPAITLMDRSFVADRRLVDWLVGTAEAENIPYQFKRPNVGSTDGRAINPSRSGVPTVALSVPCRYIHAPAAVLDLADFWHSVALLQAALARLPSVWVMGEGK